MSGFSTEVVAERAGVDAGTVARLAQLGILDGGDGKEGDYYGQTVNLAARIGDYARPGEVLVTRPVVDAADASLLAFEEIGSVELYASRRSS